MQDKALSGREEYKEAMLKVSLFSVKVCFQGFNVFKTKADVGSAFSAT